MIKVSGISLSLSPSEVRERIARRLLLTESSGFERSLSDHRLPGRGGQGELGQGCPQPWTEGSSPSRNSHSRDPRAAGKKARRGRCRPPRWRRGTGHATTIAGADGSTHPLRRNWTGDCFHGFAEPDDDTGRLSASSELLQFARLVAASGDDARFPDAGILPALEDGKIQMAFLDDRAEAIGAGVRAVKLDPCTIMMAMGMVTQRLGRATYSTTYYEPCHVARVCATMDLMLKGRASAEHRGLALQRLGQELRPRRTHGTRRPLTPGGRVHGCGPWPLEHLGRRCADPRQGEQPLCRFGKGAPAGSRGTLFSIARPIQRAALAARASRAHPGGSVRPRPVFCAKWADLVLVIFHGLQDGIREYV